MVLVMKSLLVAVSGTSTDKSVLATAYAVAAPLKAHLDFVHIPLASIDVADFNRHIEFARGGGLEVALKETFPRSEDAEAMARAHVTGLCTSRNVPWTSRTSAIDRVTASWIDCPIGSDGDEFMRAARTHDLTVIGRSATKRGWSQKLLENLTTSSGRPVLIVPSDAANFELDKVVVWWKDHSAAARAVTAALPVLGVARGVAVVSVLENDDNTAKSTEDVARQLGWHGIEATTEVFSRDHRPTINNLWAATLPGKADIVVMGGFSRPRVQEMIFGGCTQSVLGDGVRPVFLLH
jgi:nucleotide-binding universal stress UspA family protein